MTITPSRSRRSPWIVLTVLLAIIATACSTAEPELVPAALPLTEPATSVVEQVTTTIATPSTTVTPSTTIAPSTTSTTSTIAPDAYRTWIATAQDHVSWLVAYEEPAGAPMELPFLVPNPHQFGGPMSLMVTEGQPGDEWIQVQLPIRPNGQVGWIPAEDYTLTETRVRAEVNLSETHVAVYDGETLIAETQAVIGSPATPTPLGTFYVTAVRKNSPSESFLGPYALALSAFSEVHETFSGGLPVIAIHGTTRPDQVGDARSNGCIRIPNEVITFLAENVPIGAPVIISA